MTSCILRSWLVAWAVAVFLPSALIAGFGLAPGLPRAAPDQLGLDGLEEGLDGSVIVAIALAAHRRLHVMVAQDLLIVVRTVLAAAVAVENAAPRR